MSASTLFFLQCDVTYTSTNQTRASTAAVASLLPGVSLHYTNQNLEPVFRQDELLIVSLTLCLRLLFIDE